MSEQLTQNPEKTPYQLEIPYPNLIDFTAVSVTKVDESKAWKPASEVSVSHPDGSIEEGIDATTPAYLFKGESGDLSVSITAAGHIDSLHIHGAEPGSKFDYDNLTDLFTDVATKLPDGLSSNPNETSSFSIDMGKEMGSEGLASLSELVANGTLSQEDVDEASKVRNMVAELNASGDVDAMNAFVASYANEHPGAKILFEKVRGAAVVPVVRAPKQKTTELFMVFGPDGKGGKTLYTAAPGRNMPKHPIAAQHANPDGSINLDSFKQSAEAWFDTAMLVG